MEHDEDVSEKDRREQADDERFLDLAWTMQIGAAAIAEKRRLRAALADMTAERDRWMKACQEGNAAQWGMLGDAVIGFATGKLKAEEP